MKALLIKALGILTPIVTNALAGVIKEWWTRLARRRKLSKIRKENEKAITKEERYKAASRVIDNF